LKRKSKGKNRFKHWIAIVAPRRWCQKLDLDVSRMKKRGVGKRDEYEDGSRNKDRRYKRRDVSVHSVYHPAEGTKGLGKREKGSTVGGVWPSEGIVRSRV